MMPFSNRQMVAVAVSFALAAALTPAVRALARRFGMVAKPRGDRWHKQPTAMLGGASIFLTFAIVFFALITHTPQMWVVFAASAFLFGIGFVDDLLHIKPYQKLAGQVMGAAVVTYYGLSLPWTSYAPLNMAITMFWIIGITNAVNLLDNMDGLASGISAIASVFLALSFVANGQTAEALVLAVFAAALLGFLIYNSNPASIFMGDCGSMFIGFFLSSAALLSAAGGRSRSFLPVLAVPVLILLIPIFDTTLVTVLRQLSGRSPAQGGRDHTSHRLVALGLSERRAVWMLYGFAGVAGLLSMLVREAKFDVSLAVILGFTVVLTLMGVYLAGVKVYDEDEMRAAREKPLVAFLVDLSYKRRIFEVLLDVALITLSFYFSYLLLFGSLTQSGAMNLFLRAVPVLVFVKMWAFLAAGVYRGIWRYVSVDNLVTYAKAVVAGSVASVLAILFAFRFEGYSRAVFVLDAIILLMLLAASRFAFRFFRKILPAGSAHDARRVLIYGAGDGGELLLREIMNNNGLRYTPVGFIDDDRLKQGKVIHGLRVFKGNGDLRDVCARARAEEVLLSSSKFTDERVRQITEACRDARVMLRRMRIQIDTLSEE
ncbi:MAG: UDP-GlcNAc:undecaprenyl-phosphate/decaprenyl-phosphate GlcNAc-phosphate transferase [Acidobacteriota bacterium]|nr:UDP-GlcNAc:undecaprenyl-phosphate/decaprenyl-phosphate GlcNAc-phosphate transferase [Acidobacteriota bacterium]